MKQFTKHQLNKMTAKQLQESIPFLVVSDGEVIAAVIPACDVGKMKPKDVNKGELPLSKNKQARGELASMAFKE